MLTIIMLNFHRLLAVAPSCNELSVLFSIFNIYIVSSRNSRKRKQPEPPVRRKPEPLTETTALISTSESSEDSNIDIETEIKLEKKEVPFQNMGP